MREAAISFVVSVCPSAWNRLAPTGGIFMNFDIRVFFLTTTKKIQLSLKLTRITGTLREDHYTFLIVCR